MLHSDRHGCTFRVLLMNSRSRALTFGALLCMGLMLGGCAAGSPAVVVPEAPEATTTVSEVQSAAPAAAAPAQAIISDPTATPAALEIAAAPAMIPAPAANVEPTTATPGPGGAAAFAQDVQLAPQPAEPSEGATVPASAIDPVDPNANVAVDAPSAPVPAEPAVDTLAAPSNATTRPPAPPDPGTGLSEVIEGGSNGRLEVALTFDAGADAGYGAEILDLLRGEGIPATFGMTGVWAQANPALVQRMVAEGHQLINHTWDHPSLTGANTGMPPLTPEQLAAQLWDTENLVSEITGGYEMRPYFRPPYGDYDAPSLGYLYDNGFYLSIWWTCDSHGWAGWGAQEIIDYCTTNIKEDEILLLHVGASAAGDFEALPGLIQFFRDNGYEFVTVEQMLQP